MLAKMARRISAPIDIPLWIPVVIGYGSAGAAIGERFGNAWLGGFFGVVITGLFLGKRRNHEKV